MNLLKETIEELEEHKKTLDDVLWVGTQKEYMNIETFKSLSDVEYDAGYGSAQVATDLVVVGKNFFLERWEYDGSEGWSYKSFPKKPKNLFKGSSLIGRYWETLHEINETEEER